MPVVFYKLHHSTDNTKDCYVGSTENYEMRKSTHKSDCNNANSPKHNYKVYRYIRGNDGFENWGFAVLETKTYERAFKTNS